MEKVYIFCDEFGTSTLKQNDKKNITKFVYCSIIIKESQLEKAHQLRDEISNKFFNGNKIKSNRISSLNKRRKCISHLYNNLSFANHFLIVDKEKLDQDKGGLRFKEVFYKFFQKIFVSELSKSFTDFEIFMDGTISDNYGIEVKSYLANNIQNTLFDNYHFSSDDKEPLIQFADLLAGTFGRFFNKDFQHEVDDTLLDLIKSNSFSLKFFPEEEKAETKPIYSESKIDEEIFSIVRTDAFNMYEQQEDDIHKIVLEQLLMYQKVAPTVYLQTYELVNYLKYYYNKEIKIEALRLIIRDLRFKGIIVVSANSKSGYKLAVNKEDIYQYFNHYSKYILPMLKKVQIANDVFLQKTVGDFNPLSDFDELIRIVGTIKIKMN